jgi:hypothetical protein
LLRSTKLAARASSSHVDQMIFFGPDAVQFGMVFTTPSSFVLDTSENIHIWSQGGAKGLDHITQANAIISRVQCINLGTHVYMDGLAGVPP